jgi:protoporphyrinogen oxidase
MAKSCVIIGGGFRGMIGAWLLRERGVDVVLVDKAPHLGGIMYSRDWNGFVVDNGVHLFDSIPRNLGAIVEEVMDGKVFPIDFNYASVYNDVTTPGLAIPDLSHLDVPLKSKILYEVVERLTVPPRENPAALYDRFHDLYGPTAADLLDASMAHIYGAGSRELEPDALRQTAYHRLRFLPDDMTLELKKHPELDKRLAAMRRVLGKVDDFVSLYPGEGGMRGFCVKMSEKLKAKGVDIRLGVQASEIRPRDGGVSVRLDSGETLEVDHLLWAFDYGLLAKTWTKDERLAKLVHGTPMVLFWFQVERSKVRNYTYFHQFTPGRTVFRSSAAGVYSGQTKADGTTYTSAECPAPPGGELWNAPEKFVDRVWDECVRMGLLEPGARPLAHTFAKAPVTHRFAKVGFTTLAREMDERIASTRGAIVMPSQDSFTRREIMWSMEAAVERVAAS